MELCQSSNKITNFTNVLSNIFNLVFKNPLIFAIFLGLVVNTFGIPIPSPIWNSLSIIKNAALPTALFALGGALYQYRPAGDGLTICFIIFVSIILHPALVYFAGISSPLSVEQLRSAVITAAMAPGINAFLFASTYKKAQRVVASSILLGTLATVVTASVWILIL
jgi:predicted permease